MSIKISTVRHSLAHILASAVQEMYPGVKFGIGPAIQDGFYYDFDFNIEAKGREKQREITRITPEDLPRIEKKMRELIKKNLKFEKKNISVAEAKKIFKKQLYKLELLHVTGFYRFM